MEPWPHGRHTVRNWPSLCPCTSHRLIFNVEVSLYHGLFFVKLMLSSRKVRPVVDLLAFAEYILAQSQRDIVCIAVPEAFPGGLVHPGCHYLPFCAYHGAVVVSPCIVGGTWALLGLVEAQANVLQAIQFGHAPPKWLLKFVEEHLRYNLRPPLEIESGTASPG